MLGMKRRIPSALLAISVASYIWFFGELFVPMMHVIKEDDETAVIIDGNCLILQGRGEEIVRATDKLIYGLYGIIE